MKNLLKFQRYYYNEETTILTVVFSYKIVTVCETSVKIDLAI